MMETEPITILMAEDDPDDQLLTREALEENKLTNELFFVEDGAELLDYLHQRGKFLDAEKFPRPDLILLDLNMPRMDGRKALEQLKDEPGLRHIPVVVLTTSKAEEDILRTYDLGASGFVTKPVSFEGLIEAMRVLGEYWFSIVKLPSRKQE